MMRELTEWEKVVLTLENETGVVHQSIAQGLRGMESITHFAVDVAHLDIVALLAMGAFALYGIFGRSKRNA